MLHVLEGNRAVYEQRPIVAQYVADNDLTPTEARLLARYDQDIAGKRVLDLGVGAGRTTPHLVDRAAYYVGVDLSEAMVAACRERYPQIDFRRCDARDLSQFGDANFDCALFAFNGIDYVGHEDRAHVLREVARVLKPGGAFLFSSHNLAVIPSGTFLHSALHLTFSVNPLRFAKAVARAGVNVFNYAKNATGQRRTDDYAILVDPAHGFVLLTYYVSVEEQRRQLRSAGFSSMIDVEPGTDEAVPYYLYYAARKEKNVPARRRVEAHMNGEPTVTMRGRLSEQPDGRRG